MFRRTCCCKPGSLLQGYRMRKAYVATQGPMQETMTDFWRMVLECGCKCLVMLCQAQEDGQVSKQVNGSKSSCCT